MATELESKRKSLSGLPGRSSHFPAPFDSPLSHSMVTRLRRDGSFVGIPAFEHFNPAHLRTKHSHLNNADSQSG